MRDEKNVYLERLGQDYASSLMEDGDADESWTNVGKKPIEAILPYSKDLEIR